jgi:hypothetical protein
LRYLAAPLIRTRALIAFSLALVAALLLAACGGGGNDEDPQQVLDRTSASIHSGTFDLDVRLETSGGDSPGKVEAKLGGKFQSQGADKFPELDLDVSLKAEGGSQSFSGTGGLISTGDNAFINFQGTDYSVPRSLYDEFVSTYAQLQSQNGSTQSQDLLQSLNINLSDWLTDLNNDGTEDVEGTKTIHISGSANVPQIVDDLKRIATKAGKAAGNVNPAELDRLKDTIKSGDVDVYTGEDDNLLRRLQLNLELEPPAGTPGAPDSLTVFVQLNFANVNQPQTVEAPANAQPLEVLLNRYGIDAGQLGDALRGGLGSSGALPESGGSTAAPSPSAAQSYQQCLQQASGVDELQQCASLLGQ